MLITGASKRASEASGSNQCNSQQLYSNRKSTDVNFSVAVGDKNADWQEMETISTEIPVPMRREELLPHFGYRADDCKSMVRNKSNPTIQVTGGIDSCKHFSPKTPS